MDVISNTLTLINLIFVAFGVFIAVETLIFRINQKKENSTTLGDNSQDSDILDKFSEEFRSTRLGGEIVISEIELRKEGIKVENSNIVKSRKKQYYVKFSHLIHDTNPYDEYEKLTIIFLFPLVLFGFVPIALSIFLEHFFEIEFYLYIFPFCLVLLISSFFMPFGLYSDTKSKTAKIVYGLFSLGRVSRVKCTIVEQPDLRYRVFIIYCFKYFFTEIEMLKEVKTETIKDGVMEYLIARDISLPLNKGHKYRFVEADKPSKAVNEWVQTVQFGWLRIIHIFSYRIGNIINLLTNRFTRTR